MLYYLYEIKNNINGKIYLGVHKTKVEDDGYMGSGKIIRRAIKKHGLDNFTKTILEYFDNAPAMFAREKEIVTDEFLARPDIYNLRRGGTGGFDYINKQGFVRNQSHFVTGNTTSSKGGISTRDKKIAIFSDESREKAKKVKHERYPHGTFYQKKHTEETLLLMRDSHTGLQTGTKNSQFGKMWITDGISSKTILKETLIPPGWRKGRVCTR